MLTQTCETCNGQCFVPCSHCKGDGKQHLAIQLKGYPEGTCPWCRGDKTEYCPTCNGRGKVHPPEPQRSIDKMWVHHKWILLVKSVVDKQNRKNPPTKRLVTAIKKLLPENVSISWNPDTYATLYEITIWINGPRNNEYEDRLTLTWSRGQGYENRGSDIEALRAADHPSWARLDEELQREDQIDTLERIESERTIRAMLTVIDGQIANLEEQIAVLRESAKSRLEELPEPESATIRKGSPFNKQPTIWARTKFPHIWPERK